MPDRICKKMTLWFKKPPKTKMHASDMGQARSKYLLKSELKLSEFQTYNQYGYPVIIKKPRIIRTRRK